MLDLGKLEVCRATCPQGAFADLNPAMYARSMVREVAELASCSAFDRLSWSENSIGSLLGIMANGVVAKGIPLEHIDWSVGAGPSLGSADSIAEATELAGYFLRCWQAGDRDTKGEWRQNLLHSCSLLISALEREALRQGTTINACLEACAKTRQTGV